LQSLLFVLTFAAGNSQTLYAQISCEMSAQHRLFVPDTGSTVAIEFNKNARISGHFLWVDRHGPPLAKSPGD